MTWPFLCFELWENRRRKTDCKNCKPSNDFKPVRTLLCTVRISVAQTASYYLAGAFFPEGVTSHIKTSSTQIFGSPVFGSHLELLKLTLTFFRFEVHDLQILKIVYLTTCIPIRSCHITTLTSKLVHWCVFLVSTNLASDRPRGVNLSISVTPLKVCLHTYCIFERNRARFLRRSRFLCTVF